MTQRVFDVYNEQDMQDLWSMLPDDLENIDKYPYGIINPFAGFTSKKTRQITFIKINWRDKTEITRPVNYESMIGCIGWFWDKDDKEKSLGVLTEYDFGKECPFVKNKCIAYSKFCPTKKSELKFWGEE